MRGASQHPRSAPRWTIFHDRARHIARSPRSRFLLAQPAPRGRGLDVIDVPGPQHFRYPMGPTMLNITHSAAPFTAAETALDLLGDEVRLAAPEKRIDVL